MTSVSTVTFDGTTLHVRVTLTGPDVESEKTVIKIPDTSTTVGPVYIDYAGAGAVPMIRPVKWLKYSDYITFLSKVGRSGTYVDWDGTTYANTVLVRATCDFINPVATDFVCTGVCEFIAPLA